VGTITWAGPQAGTPLPVGRVSVAWVSVATGRIRAVTTGALAHGASEGVFFTSRPKFAPTRSRTQDLEGAAGVLDQLIYHPLARLDCMNQELYRHLAN
jgi:hypothetical protein